MRPPFHEQMHTQIVNRFSYLTDNNASHASAGRR